MLIRPRAARRAVARLAAAALVVPLLAAVTPATATPATGAAAATPAAATATSATSPIAAAAGRRRVRVLAPREGAVLLTRSLGAARKLQVNGRVHLNGHVGHVTALLNGHRLTGTVARAGTQRITMDANDGLAVGENLLWVSASFPGASAPEVVPVRFVVAYRTRGLLTSGLRLGRGSGPAAALTVRAPLTGVSRIQATLNGRRLHLPKAEPELPGHRLLALDLAQLGHLRRGLNRLHLRLIMSDGRVQVTSATFRLDRRRDIAVAHAGGVATVGHTTALDALRSQLAGGELRSSRWVLLRRPPGSKARLGATVGARTTLRPDLPGTYLVGLRVGTGYDLLSVPATYPNPLVPLNTIVYGANTSPPIAGVQIGSNVYLSTFQAIQVVVLNRATLGLVDNRGYSTNQFDALGEYLKSLTADDLVIVTHPGNQATLPSNVVGQLDTDLRTIGGAMAAQWMFGYSPCWSGATNYCQTSSTTWQRSAVYGGSFTVIGVPGMPAGQAWRQTAVQNHSVDGAITGYLTLGVSTDSGVANQYTVVPGPTRTSPSPPAPPTDAPFRSAPTPTRPPPVETDSTSSSSTAPRWPRS